MPPSTPVVHLNLRLPPDLHRQLTEWAGREHRSLHAQVLHVLTDALDREAARRARRAKTAPTE
jgi:hypothetical protein